MLIAGFDLETTGLDGTRDHIVQYSFQIFNGSERILNQTSLVNPEVEITASEIHGIYTEDLIDAPLELASLQSIDSLFRNCYMNSIPVVVMNAKFDITFYRSALLSHYGILPQASYVLIDPMVIDKHFDKYRPGKRNLETLASVYVIPHGEGFHDAGYDVEISISIARSQISKWDLGNDWVKLHHLQSDWSDRQTKSLAEYFMSSGNDAYKHMKLGWPVETQLLIM